MRLQNGGHCRPQSRHRLDHVPFGLVLGPDGKKFKTRSGETEKLIDLFKKAIEKADRSLTRKKTGNTRKLNGKSLAKAIGIAAIKYADLSTHRLSDYSFSYDKMLKFEGNTAVFLLYSNVPELRASSEKAPFRSKRLPSPLPHHPPIRKKTSSSSV